MVWAGSAVKGLREGDRVAIEPGVPCAECSQCLQGHYNLCRVVNFSGAPPHHGSIRRFHSHPAKFLHRLPDSLSYADGALLEPLSVVMHAFERSPIRLGEWCPNECKVTVLMFIGEPTVICGAGPIGLIALTVARASGACPIAVTDIDQSRLDFATRLVPGCVPVKVDTSGSPEHTALAVLQSLRCEAPRVVFECSGVQSSVSTACYLARPGGEVMVIGVGRAKMDDLPFMHLSMAEVSNIQRDKPESRVAFPRGRTSDLSNPGRPEVHQSLPSLVAVGDASACPRGS